MDSQTNKRVKATLLLGSIITYIANDIEAVKALRDLPVDLPEGFEQNDFEKACDMLISLVEGPESKAPNSEV
jgi:hypothetical protein